MGEGLGALQAWFAAHCDGNWEQEYGVTIGTVEEPGWERASISSERGSGKRAGVRVRSAVGDWCEAWCDGYTFHAVGGTHNLDELLGTFVTFAERQSAPIEA